MDKEIYIEVFGYIYVKKQEFLIKSERKVLRIKIANTHRVCEADI